MGRKFSGVGGVVDESSKPFVAKLLQSKCEYMEGSTLFAIGCVYC